MKLQRNILRKVSPAQSARVLRALEHLVESIIVQLKGNVGCVFISIEGRLEAVAIAGKYAQCHMMSPQQSGPTSGRAWPMSLIREPIQNASAMSDIDELGVDVDLNKVVGNSICLPIGTGKECLGAVYIECETCRSSYDVSTAKSLRMLLAMCSEFLLQHRELNEERDLLEAMIEDVPSLHFVKDCFGKFIAANKALLTAFGLQGSDELIGKSDEDFFPSEAVHHISILEKEIIRSGKPIKDYEEYNPNLKGGPYWFSISKAPLYNYNNEIVGVICSCHDITHSKRQEYELSRQNYDLKTTNSTLQKTQSLLVQAEKLASLGSITVGISHALNTPIGNSLTVSSAIQDESRNFLDQIGKGLISKKSLSDFVSRTVEGANIIQSSLARAVDLIGSFKNVALDQSAMECRKFPLAESLKDLMEIIRSSNTEENFEVSLNCADEMTLYGYPGGLAQVVLQLANNAIMHGTKPGQKLHIQIHARPGSDDRVLLQIIDDGEGMTELTLSRIFDPFFTTKLGAGGTGLGMYVVHQLVTTLMKGFIQASSVKGGGATIEISIPRVMPD